MREIGICNSNRPDAFGLILGAVPSSRDNARNDGWEGAMDLTLDVSRTDDIAVIRARGRIVFGTEADELRRVVLDLLNETQRIVLNLAWIGHIDSTGLGTLVASFISARHRGAEIKFAALSPEAHRVVTTTHVDRLFEIYDSTEEAIKSFHPHPEAAAG
jgi:anti-sigma B factor antagonist